jgi:NADPH-dependent curcumin reductase CurA
MPRNKQILLDNRPQGEASAANFKLVTGDTPALQDGQVLVKHHFLSLDPYMRGRMNDGKSYAQPQPVGQVMQGGTVGEVTESRSPKFSVGDKVAGMGGWQEYSVVDAAQAGMLRKLDTTHVPLSHYLGAVGMPGVTAWYGLNRIIEPKAGETLVVSAASGAVGSAFGAYWPRRADAARWALRAGRTSASTWSMNWALMPASITSSTRMRRRCPRRSKKCAPAALMGTSRTWAAWSWTP